METWPLRASGPGHRSHAARPGPPSGALLAGAGGPSAASPHVRPTRTGTLRSPLLETFSPAPRMAVGPCLPPSCLSALPGCHLQLRLSAPTPSESVAPACKRGTMLSRREGQQGGQGAHRVVRGEASQPRGQGGITWGLLCLRDPSRSFTWKDLGFYSDWTGEPQQDLEHGRGHDLPCAVKDCCLPILRSLIYSSWPISPHNVSSPSLGPHGPLITLLTMLTGCLSQGVPGRQARGKMCPVLVKATTHGREKMPSPAVPAKSTRWDSGVPGPDFALPLYV